MDHLPVRAPKIENTATHPPVQLQNVDLTLPDTFIDGKYIERIPVTMNGIPLVLEVTNIDMHNDILRTQFEVNLTVFGNENTEIASSYVYFEKTSNGELDASSAVESIRQKDKSKQIPELGRTLYAVLLGLIQKYADKWKIPITHFVVRQVHGGLKQEKWDELLNPLLTEKGYVDKGVKYGNAWEKKYIPTN